MKQFSILLYKSRDKIRNNLESMSDSKNGEKMKIWILLLTEKRKWMDEELTLWWFKKARGKQLLFIMFQICFIHFLFVKQRSISVTKLLTGYVIRKMLPRLNFHLLQRVDLDAVYDWCIHARSLLLRLSKCKVEKRSFEVTKEVSDESPLQRDRSRVSFSFFLSVSSLCHIYFYLFSSLVKVKWIQASIASSHLCCWQSVAASSSSSSGSICPSLTSFPNRRQISNIPLTFLNHKVLQYTVKQIMYIFLIWCCFWRLRVRVQPKCLLFFTLK